MFFEAEKDLVTSIAFNRDLAIFGILTHAHYIVLEKYALSRNIYILIECDRV